MQNKRNFYVKDETQVYGILSYAVDTKEFHLTIHRDIDTYSAPILISMFADKGMYELDAGWSLRWVKERIIPPGRQNIREILSANQMTEYDEFQMLLFTNGKCPQDDMWIEEIST